MFGLREIAPIFANRDWRDSGEDPIASCLAAQKPKLDGCGAGQCTLKTGALKELVHAIGGGVDVLLGQRVAEDRQATTLIPEIAKDSAHIVAGRAHVQYIGRGSRRCGGQST